MVRIRLGGIVGAAVSTGLLLKRTKKNKTTKGAEPGELEDAEVISTDHQAKEVKERTCPGCGNKDTTGAERCPLCYAEMDPQSIPDDI